MAEFEEIFEGGGFLDEIGGLDEMGDLGEGLDSAEAEALDDAEAEAEEQFQDFNEDEIIAIDENTPEQVNNEVNNAVENADVEDLSEDQVDAAKEEGKDPEKPKKNLKTRLKKVWSEYGSFLKGVGKFAVTAIGEYFKWAFIFQVVELTQKDIEQIITILHKQKSDPNNNTTVLTNFLTYIDQVNTITKKIDGPLKIITGAGTTTNSGGLADLFANYFSLRASEDLTQTGTALLQAGEKVIMDNYNAFKALGLPTTPTENDLAKLDKNTISSAIGKLSVANLDAFIKAAQAHQKNLDKYLKGLDTSENGAKELKASLTLPPDYAKTFANLETFVKNASA